MMDEFAEKFNMSPAQQSDKDIVAVPMDLVELIVSVGKACWGEVWRDALARNLGIERKTITRWEKRRVTLTEEMLRSKYLERLEQVLNANVEKNRRELERKLRNHDQRVARIRRELARIRAK